MLTNTQVSKTRKDFANSSSANIKFSEKQLSQIVQLGGYVGNFLDLLNPHKSPISNPEETFKKFFNKADELSKEVIINDKTSL